MKFVFFAKGDRRLPSARTRAWLLADYLRAEGYDAACYRVYTRSWWNISAARFSDFFRNIQLLWSAKKGDIVFLQRTVHQLDFMLLVLIRKYIFGRGYVFDFDDAIFLEKGSADLKARLIISNADTVFCGNAYLKEYADKYSKNAHVMTTLFDTDYVYVPYPDKKRLKETIIGWTGTPVHYDNLKIVIPALERLVKEGYPIRVQLVGGGPKIAELFQSVPGLAVTPIALLPSSGIWAEPRESVRYLQNFDIGLMPLEATEWNKGKDAHKAKEYMCCGVTPLVSNWGDNPRLVHEGENGVLANDDEWYEKFKALIDDPEYREQLAARGRAFAEEHCSFRKFVPQMIDIMTRHA